MTRRKREIIGLTNERDFPHLVELALPPGGFRSVFLEIDAFHRDRRIPVRRGRSRHEAEQLYIRFCFPEAATADAFRNRFGGELIAESRLILCRHKIQSHRGHREHRDGEMVSQIDTFSLCVLCDLCGNSSY